jgi:phosphatidylglycerol:prolipoprotein diacylglycerol transferase
MYNDWFSIGPITVHGYGAMIAIGILAAFWLGVQLILAIIASCKQSILYYYIFIVGLCQQHFS